jgi:uncharacterized protein
MFPLGLALLPGMALPLRLFEPRYLEMYADIVDADREFGVVLIERGIESRDDNPTFDVGCIAHMIGSGLNDDGTIAIVAIGGNRIRVAEWLDSSPYPLAIVEEMEDDPLTEWGMSELHAAADLLPGMLAVAAELDPGFESTIPELSDDPARTVYQLAQLAGAQTIDLQQVLEAETSDARAALVRRLMLETLELIQLQLGMTDT